MVEPYPSENDGVSSSVGVMTFPTEWKKIMFQTTNQVAMTYPVNLYPMMAVSSLIYEKLENKEGFPLASW